MSTASVAGSPMPASEGRRLSPRQRQIVEVASDAFAVRGYFNVSLDEIAAALGMSGPALYRHFRNKYDLFVACAHDHVGAITDAWPKAPLGVDLREPAAARAELDRVVLALLDVTVARRRAGGMYRWEGRYLEPADRDAVGARYQGLVERLATLVRAPRPDLSQEQTRMLAIAVLSVVGSVTSHRTSPTASGVGATVLALVGRVLAADLAPQGSRSPAAAPPPPADDASRRDLIIEGAIGLFHRKGFGEVTIEEIAASAGLAPSGLYRHFPGKSDVLFAVCERAALRMEAAVEAAGIRGIPADDALAHLATAYVDHCFANHEQVSVSYSSIGSLSADDQDRLRDLQRDHLATWTTLLTVRDADRGVDLDIRAARYVVMAAVNVVTDVGRSVGWDPSQRGAVESLVAAVIG